MGLWFLTRALDTDFNHNLRTPPVPLLLLFGSGGSLLFPLLSCQPWWQKQPGQTHTGAWPSAGSLWETLASGMSCSAGWATSNKGLCWPHWYCCFSDSCALPTQCLDMVLFFKGIKIDTEWHLMFYLKVQKHERCGNNKQNSLVYRWKYSEKEHTPKLHLRSFLSCLSSHHLVLRNLKRALEDWPFGSQSLTNKPSSLWAKPLQELLEHLQPLWDYFKCFKNEEETKGLQVGVLLYFFW